MASTQAAPPMSPMRAPWVMMLISSLDLTIRRRMQAGAIGLDERAEGALVSVAGRSDEFLRTGRY